MLAAFKISELKMTRRAARGVSSEPWSISTVKVLDKTEAIIA